jgi:hypothetical protein
MHRATTYLSLAVSITLLAAGTVFGASTKESAREAPKDVTPPASGWSKLHADDTWYTDLKQPEQVFAGILERSKDPGGASILMRSHRYKLGGRSIYPADVDPLLEKLVGKAVEIKGKPNDMELEGQAVHEIWPAAIRATTPALEAAVAAKNDKPADAAAALNAGKALALIEVTAITEEDMRPADGELFDVVALKVVKSSGKTPAEIRILKGYAYPQIAGAPDPGPVPPSILHPNPLVAGQRYWLIFNTADKRKYPQGVVAWWPEKSAPAALDAALTAGKFGQPKVITIETSEIGGPKAGASATPSTTQAATSSAATFDVRCNKKEDAVTVTADVERTVFVITSPSGIGGATLERKGAVWPKQVVLRIHLKGLESLSLTSGNLKLSASVASHSGNPRTLTLLRKQAKDAPPLTKDSPYWTDIVTLDAKGKPVSGLPDKDGYFEMVVPQAFLDEGASKLTIGWIDFYR